MLPPTNAIIIIFLLLKLIRNFSAINPNCHIEKSTIEL